jgi:c-di-GMP-binding flagellar brake protein YcgR
MPTGEFWDDRKRPRGHYTIPCLLRDVETTVYVKAVMLDLSADGCRVFTNDHRVRAMTADRLVGKRFHLEFDFEDLDTSGVVVEVVNVHPGKNPERERQMGLRFVDIDPDLARSINRIVLRDAAAAGHG